MNNKRDIRYAESYVIYVDSDRKTKARNSNGKIEFKGDDAVAVVQNAINRSVTGSTIFIKDGTYILNDELVDNGNDNIIIQGESWNTLFRLGANANSHVFSLTSSSGWTFRNFQIDGNKTNQSVVPTSVTRGNYSGLKFDNCTYMNVENCWIHDVLAGATIALSNSTSNSQILNNRLADGGRASDGGLCDGVYCDGDHNWIGDNTISGMLDTGVAYDYNTTNSKGSYGNILDNYIYDCQNGIQSWYGVTGLRVIGNDVINSILNAMYFKGSTSRNITNFKIVDNTVDTTGTNGNSGDLACLRLRQARKGIVRGNTITNGGQMGIFIEGISGTNVSNVEIMGNLIYNNGQKGSGERQGIDIEDDNSVGSGATYVHIAHNNIFDDQRGKTQVWAIKEQGRSNYSIIEFNDFRNNINTPPLSFVGTSTIVKNNQGFKTESNVLSGTFAIDSMGIKTVTIAHGLAITPAVQDCYLTVVQNTAVDNWAYNLLKIVSTDTTNVVAKISVSIASATGSATAKLGLKVGNP